MRLCDQGLHPLQPLEQGKTAWDNGKLGFNGRGRGSAALVHGINNPLTNTWSSLPANMQHVQAMQLSGQPATLEKRWQDNGTLPVTRSAPCSGPAAEGASFDPITHRGAPEGSGDAARQKEQDRLWGRVGVKHQAPPQGNYNPIKCANSGALWSLPAALLQGQA